METDPRKSPKLGAFYAFLCVYYTRSYSRSAEAMSCSQSSVSRLVDSLESWLGAELFTKTIPPRPNETADKLRSKLEEFLNCMDEIRAESFIPKNENEKKVVDFGMIKSLIRGFSWKMTFII